MSTSTAPITRESIGDRVVFVDFDHTLFTANSTEMFISRCRPMLITSIIEFLLRRCLPWRWLRVARWHSIRDYACVSMLILLMPWNLLRWRRYAPEIFHAHKSEVIERTLESVDSEKIVVISFGMSFLIRPLLGKTRFRDSRLIAIPGLPGRRDLLSGKRDLALARLREGEVLESVFLTDSGDDQDLLSFCRDGRLISRQGKPNPCHHHLYLPFRYLLNAKYRANYVIDQIIFVDLPIYFIATASPFAGALLPHALSCLSLMLSQLCIYEIGYFENDMVAARKELHPTLSACASDYAHYPCGAPAWISACLFYVGFFLVRSSTDGVAIPSCSDVILWFSYLCVLRLLFYIYNRVKENARMRLYPCLQFAKYAAIVCYLGCGALGCFIVMAQVATMWMNYCVYRSGGKISREFLEFFRSIIIFSFLIMTSNRVLNPIIVQPITADDVGMSSGIFLVCVWCSFRLLKKALLDVVRRASSGASYHSPPAVSP